MNKKKLIIHVITGITAMELSSVAASATTEYPEGGQWNYGAGIIGTYSDYLHGKRKHSSTVTKGSKSNKSTANKGNRSKGRLTEYKGCNVYYNVL